MYVSADLIWLAVALPLAGFLALGALGKRMPRGIAALVGVGSVGIAFALALGIFAKMLGAHVEERPDGLLIHGPTRLRGAVVECLACNQIIFQFDNISRNCDHITDLH